MMAHRWVIDPDHPDGHLVVLTAEEEAQLLLDRQTGTAEARAQENADGNELALRDRLERALTDWPDLDAGQKDEVLKALVRLALRRLDSAG